MLPAIGMAEEIREAVRLTETAALIGREIKVLPGAPAFTNETVAAVRLPDGRTVTTPTHPPMILRPRRRLTRSAKLRRRVTCLEAEVAELRDRLEVWEARWFVTQLEPPHPEDDAPEAI